MGWGKGSHIKGVGGAKRTIQVRIPAHPVIFRLKIVIAALIGKEGSHKRGGVMDLRGVCYTWES